MAADAWKIYDSLKRLLGEAVINFSTHTFKVQLHSSVYVPNLATQQYRADLSGELGTANGYTAGGQTLGSISWLQAGATSAFKSAYPLWTAVGGPIVARYAVVYDDTPLNDPLVCYALLDSAPADVTTVAGGTLQLQLDPSGILVLAGGN